MSALLMGLSYELDLSKGQQSVLLALADHGQDDGSDVYPSIGRVAWKTGYNRRHVQRMMRELEELGVLVKVKEATRTNATEYRIDLDAGKKKAPYKPADAANVARGDIQDNQGRHLEQSGAASRPPQPSVKPSVKPSKGTSLPASSKKNPEIDAVGGFFFRTFKPRRQELDTEQRRFIREALKVASADECCTAIKKCAASDWHQKRGDHANRTGRKYNRISDILKGRRGKESTRERIDWWLDLDLKVDADSKAFGVDADARADAALRRREQQQGVPLDA